MEAKLNTLAERLAAVETTIQMHLKSCDRKGSVQIALLLAVLGSVLSGIGVAWFSGPHLLQ
jgi:hypothetical protein